MRRAGVLGFILAIAWGGCEGSFLLPPTAGDGGGRGDGSVGGGDGQALEDGSWGDRAPDVSAPKDIQTDIQATAWDAACDIAMVALDRAADLPVQGDWTPHDGRMPDVRPKLYTDRPPPPDAPGVIVIPLDMGQGRDLPSHPLEDGGSSNEDAPPSVTGQGLCAECQTADECGAPEDLCLFYSDTGETFCSRECTWLPCPEGFSCTEIATDEGPTMQCTPNDRTCQGHLPLCDPPCPAGEVCDQGQCFADECEPPCSEDEVCQSRQCVPNDGLGPCSGTAEECEAARAVNDYRANHTNQGECNNRLRWDDNLGQMAHDHQSGPFVQHSSYGYIECCGQAYGAEETAEYICEYTPGIEPHCASNGAYVMSHHCACMYCNNYTIGVGVYQAGSTTYMTIIFGDENGQPSW